MKINSKILLKKIEKINSDNDFQVFKPERSKIYEIAMVNTWDAQYKYFKTIKSFTNYMLKIGALNKSDVVEIYG